MKRIFLFSCCIGFVVQWGFGQHFEPIPASYSGIEFSNVLEETQKENIITYEYFYNGGGLGAADFNNDGLTDLIFTSNQNDPKLYLNLGDLKFLDITNQSGLNNLKGWKTGIALADVNNDGWIDIYISFSGNYPQNKRRNKLFINQKDLSFKEEAQLYGVDDPGYTSQSAFLDYDNDGDLDLFVLNHNTKYFRNFDAAFVKNQVDLDAGDRLYKNTGSGFEDVTVQAGIRSNPIGYGLGIAIADLNNDGWPDIYVTNDYVEEDYLYFNNQDGTFTDKLKSQIPVISNFSMGVDTGDINNDGFIDLVTLDMLPEDNRRQKLLYAPDNFEVYNNMVTNGFHHQTMRNMLQLNNGDGTFSDIGQFAGISATDWSWAPLLADFNNDGLLDLYITNGYGRDMINRDVMKFYIDERLKYEEGKSDDKMLEALQGIPSTSLQNYLFINQGDNIFKNETDISGLKGFDFSHGALYADLDNDGDLEIVVNCANETAKLFKNKSVELDSEKSNFLKVELQQPNGNPQAIGCRVTVFSDDGEQRIREMTATHGFQSSISEPLHFGLGRAKPDSIQVRWNDGTIQTLKEGLSVNQNLKIQKGTGDRKPDIIPLSFVQITQDTIPYKHNELLVNDFKVQPLLPYMISYHGPKIKKIDLNNDGLDDLFIGGPEGEAPTILLQSSDGKFIKVRQPYFEATKDFEDTNASFFDADQDGDLDLYIVSGGFADTDAGLALTDRFYTNENGIFVLSKGLPEDNLLGSVAVPWDFDQDGDLDVFVGTRVKQGNFPQSEPSLLYINDGTGNFTSGVYPFLNQLGLVKDALVADLDNDAVNELLVIGDWETPRIFSFSNNQFQEKTASFFSGAFFGWWNRVIAKDLDKDGDLDIVLGNWGTNNTFKASTLEPMELVYGDFDKNGYLDPIWCYYIQGKSYPNVLREEITDQMVGLRKKFVTYESFANATIDEILTPQQVESASKKSTTILETVWFENRDGKFILHYLPPEANYASVNAILAEDLDGDGNTDLLLAGNTDYNRVRIGKQEATYGVFLKGDGLGEFNFVPNRETHLLLHGNVRSLLSIRTLKSNKIVVGRNNDYPLLLEIKD